MTYIAMDEQCGHVFPIRLDLELDELCLTVALYSFTFDAMEEIAPMSDAKIRDYIAENIAFVGVGQLITAAAELSQPEKAGGLSTWDREWLEFCRMKVTSAYRRPHLRAA